MPETSIPIQPVNKPILCSPYAEPTEHWVYDTSTGEASRFPGRRPAGYWFKTRRTGDATLMLKSFAEEERDDLPLVNRLRAEVKRWRWDGCRNSRDGRAFLGRKGES